MTTEPKVGTVKAISSFARMKYEIIFMIHESRRTASILFPNGRIST
jgi:hypothetical protein